MSLLINFLPPRMADYSSTSAGPAASDIYGYVGDSFTSPALLSPSSPSLEAMDPLLEDFWSAFPCPPPWNGELLFRVNWTSCVGPAVGERLMKFMAHRCNIHLDGSSTHAPAGGGATRQEDGLGEEVEEGVRQTCDTACKILLVLLSVLLIVGAFVGGCVILHRQRSKRKDQRANGQQQHHQSGAGGGDGRTYYAGIHYASASIVSRDNERPLPPCPEGSAHSWGLPAGALPRQLQAYVYNPSDVDNPPPDRRFHLHLCPMNSRVAYRVMHPSSALSHPYSDTSHVYDYISDTDSIRWRGLGPARGRPLSTDFCTCEHSGDSESVACASGSGVGAGGGGGQTPGLSEGYHSDHDHHVAKSARSEETAHAQWKRRTVQPQEEREAEERRRSAGGRKVEEEDEDTTTDASSNEVDRRHALLPQSRHPGVRGSNPQGSARERSRLGCVDGSEFDDTDDDFIQHDSDLPRGRPGRVNALALHPGYFLDYFDKDTSTV